MILSLPDEIVLLRAQVDYLLEQLTEAAGAPLSSINWSSLNTDQASQQWAVLTEFVDWLRERYGLTERIPQCWFRHPAQLEELSALRLAWAGTYQHATAAHPGDAVTWHDMLDRVVGRLQEWDRTGCADGPHREQIPAPAASEDDVDRERFIHADLAERQLQPEPPDTEGPFLVREGTPS